MSRKLMMLDPKGWLMTVVRVQGKLMQRNQFTFPVTDQDFRKSSWSKNNPKTCVMVAIRPEGVAIRDSKDDTGKTLYFTHDEFKAFTRGVASGEFN